MTPKKQKEKERRRARKLADEAWDAANDGNVSLALKIVRRAVETQQDNPVLWNDLGAMLALASQDEDAEEAFRMALRVAPTFAEAFDNLARLRAKHGYVQHAADLQTQAVLHAPDRVVFRQRLDAYRCVLASSAPEKRKIAQEMPQPVMSVDQWTREAAKRAWTELAEQLTLEGVATLSRFLDATSCASLRSMFEDDSLFAKTVVMDRPEFGQGIYRYFSAPIPDLVDRLRRAIYPHVAGIANQWRRLLGDPAQGDHPADWEAFRRICHDAGQDTPTPILLKYEAGGFNSLHRDLRGAVYFPIQMVVVLSERAGDSSQESDFEGGEFLLCDVPENKKAKRRVIPASLGDAILFCTRDRLVRVGDVFGLQPVKHGMALVTRGIRYALGLPFHEYR